MADDKNPVSQTQSFGKKAWMGPLGFLGGLALMAVGALLFYATISSTSSGAVRLPIILVVFGGTVLTGSFTIKGAELSPDGLTSWKYICWFIGGKSFFPGDEIERFVLGEDAGKFTVTATLTSGEDIEIPHKWAAFKDAQTVIDTATKLYGTAAAVNITDEKALIEAATFSKSKTWKGAVESSLFKTTITFENEDDEQCGEIRKLGGLFRRRRCEIDGANEPNRWLLSGRFWGGVLDLSEKENDAGDVNSKSDFLGRSVRFWWADPAGQNWSALLTSEQNSRDPFTLKLFKGFVEGSGPNPKEADGGEVVAIADGPLKKFRVDVADESAWPWVRIALATMWMKWVANG